MRGKGCLHACSEAVCGLRNHSGCHRGGEPGNSIDQRCAAPLLHRGHYHTALSHPLITLCKWGVNMLLYGHTLMRLDMQ